MPEVSIIIPTFNRESLIGETLDSILAQTYKNWECIVIDDGSTDDTHLLMEQYCNSDKRFKFVKRPTNRRKGASTCRNIGLELCKGEFIQFLDSDDLISENKLEEQVNLLRANIDNDLATCKWGRFTSKIGDGMLFTELKAYNDYDDIFEFLNDLTLSKGYFPLHSYLIKKELLLNIGMWNEYLSINDDGEYMMRVFLNTKKIVCANKATAYYRWTNNTNLSAFNDINRVNDAVNSWIAIESLLKIRFKKDAIPYIDFVKKGIYLNVKKSFPDLLLSHKYFFKEQLKQDSWCSKLKNRILAKLIKRNA